MHTATTLGLVGVDPFGGDYPFDIRSNIYVTFNGGTDN